MLGRGKEPRVTERAWPFLQLNFGLLTFITMGKQISVVFRHPVCDTLSREP